MTVPGSERRKAERVLQDRILELERELEDLRRGGHVHCLKREYLLREDVKETARRLTERRITCGRCGFSAPLFGDPRRDGDAMGAHYRICPARERRQERGQAGHLPGN